MDPIVTTELPAPVPQRDPSEAELQAAREVLGQLDAEARALGRTPSAAPVHYAMGRIFIEQLGDQKSAATCYQNSFLLNPEYRPNLEAARRLFASAGQLEKSLALHQREAALLKLPQQRAESLRAQSLLLASLGRHEEAARLVQEALELAPEHPGLLEGAIAIAEREGDRPLCARLLVRAAGNTRDPVYKAQLLRRALLLTDELLAEPEGSGMPPPTEPTRASLAELEALHEEAARKLHQADGNDPIGFFAMLIRARRSNDWEAVLRLSRARAERTASAAERATVAAIAAYRLGRASEGLAEVAAALEESRRDGGLLALRTELAEQQKSPDLAEMLRLRAEGCIEPSERGHLKLRAAMLLQDSLEREQLLSDALAENPGDAAAIALHARLVALRDPTAGAERFVALGESLQEHSPDEAAAHFLEAGAWAERAQNFEESASLARRALQLLPRHVGALRLLTRALPALGAHEELADLVEEAAGQLPRAVGAELLARGAALVVESQPERAILLARRGAEMARGLTSPRWLETWSMVSLRANDLGQISQALEARADSTQGADAADLLLEASELSRAMGDDPRSTALLRKARGVDPHSGPARNALLALPGLPAGERTDLLLEEARATEPPRAAALHAERAALLEGEGRIDEAVQACAQALALAGVDLAVLRRLARLQLRRGDHAAALAVLVQIAEAVPEGHARAEAYGRAAELAEWRVGEPKRAIELYKAAAEAWPQAAFAWAQLGRLLAWTGKYAQAAEAWERLAQAAQSVSERNEARRAAASLYAHRAGEPGKANALLRALLADAPGDLEATAELLALIGLDKGAEARKERAELRGKLASRCQDPRVAALLRSESGEDRLAAGDRDQGIAEYRRALALNPQDRVALDLVEEALRSSGQRGLLAEHLAFRGTFAEGDTRAALALEQAEIFAEQGQIEAAGAAYQQALAADPDSLHAVRGARHIAELTGDKQEVMRLLAREASLARDPVLAAGAMVEAALLAVDLGDHDEAVHHLTSVLEHAPDNQEAALKLRGLFGEGAPQALSEIYERIGQGHGDPRLGCVAWTQAASIRLHELKDPAQAFFAAGRALARDQESVKALEIRADSAETAGRPQEAAEALQRRLAMGGDEPRAEEWKLRLGRLWAELGEAEKALPLLDATLSTLTGPLLLKLAPGARSLRQSEAVRLYARLLEVFPAPVENGPSRVQLAEWTDELARGYIALGQPEEALAAFKRSVQLEPRNRSALRHVADLSAQHAPADAVFAHRALLDMTPPAADSLHALVVLFNSTGRADAAFCAAAALAGLGLATPEEKALYEAAAGKPPPAELPQLADSSAVHATGDEGAARDLLAAAAQQLARALPTDMSNGRGALVKGDNPVRRVMAAICRALGIGEPQLFLARGEPAVVSAVAAETPGLLVGAEVPKRFSPRQQRFLYARALAHIRRGSHAIAGMPAARLGALLGELVRLAAPQGTDFARLPQTDSAVAELLARQLGPEARARLAPLALRAAAEMPTNFEPLVLGMRESAERTGLAVSADPAAALSLVSAECQGGLDRPEVARLVRFAVSEAYLSLRPG